jgi:hypothetical protein
MSTIDDIRLADIKVSLVRESIHGFQAALILVFQAFLNL